MPTTATKIIPRSGDNVRVVLEGVVSHSTQQEFSIGGLSQRNLISTNADHVKSIELLLPPERDWQIGDLVKSAAGFFYTYSGSGEWKGVRSGVNFPNSSVVRPLTHYVEAPK